MATALARVSSSSADSLVQLTNNVHLSPTPVPKLGVQLTDDVMHIIFSLYYRKHAYSAWDWALLSQCSRRFYHLTLPWFYRLIVGEDLENPSFARSIFAKPSLGELVQDVVWIIYSIEDPIPTYYPDQDSTISTLAALPNIRELDIHFQTEADDFFHISHVSIAPKLAQLQAFRPLHLQYLTITSGPGYWLHFDSWLLIEWFAKAARELRKITFGSQIDFDDYDHLPNDMSFQNVVRIKAINTEASLLSSGTFGRFLAMCSSVVSISFDQNNSQRNSMSGLFETVLLDTATRLRLIHLDAARLFLDQAGQGYEESCPSISTSLPVLESLVLDFSAANRGSGSARFHKTLDSLFPLGESCLRLKTLHLACQEEYNKLCDFVPKAFEMPEEWIRRRRLDHRPSDAILRRFTDREQYPAMSSFSYTSRLELNFSNSECIRKRAGKIHGHDRAARHVAEEAAIQAVYTNVEKSSENNAFANLGPLYDELKEDFARLSSSMPPGMVLEYGLHRVPRVMLSKPRTLKSMRQRYGEEVELTFWAAEE